MSSYIKKFVLNAIFIPFFWLFSYIIPKKRNLILIGSCFGYKFTGNPKFYYLYSLTQNDGKFDTIWITRNRNIYKSLKKEAKPVAYLYSFFGIWIILRAKYLMIESASQDITGRTFLLGNFKIIECWHGTPLKNITHDESKDQTLLQKIFWYFIKKELKLYIFVLACSESAAKNMRLSLSNDNVQIIGYPRNDVFFDKKLSYANYEQEMDLNKYNKVLLYSPTFRDNAGEIIQFTELFSIQLNAYLKEKNYILLVKNHPVYGKNIQISKSSNIKNISDTVDDIQEILIHTDILIQDYTSIMFDFCLLNRPIVFYCYDYDNYLKGRKMYYEYFTELPGPFASNEDELLDLIKNVDQWFNDPKYKVRYISFKNKFNQFQDGMACERLYNYILNYENFCK